eukprot:m51a1_g11768 hypothetical protein (266) ;mRNA; f:238888-239755
MTAVGRLIHTYAEGPALSSPQCYACARRVYLVEGVQFNALWLHRACFKCYTCKKSLTPSSGFSFEGHMYCKQHLRAVSSPARAAATYMRPVPVPKCPGKFEMPVPLHSCGYGATPIGLAQNGPSLDDLSDRSIMLALSALARVATCHCHKGRLVTEAAAVTLCNLSLCCKRLRELSEFAAQEAVLRLACNAGKQPDGKTWKEKLFRLDPSVQERLERLQKKLYCEAFTIGFVHPKSECEAARKEIIRRWGTIDEALKTKAQNGWT